MPILDSEFAVCWKRPKWFIDLSHYGCSEEQLAENYRRRKRSPERAIESAHRQSRTRELAADHLPADCFIPRNDLTQPMLNGKRLFVCAGGDNHSIWGMRYAPRGESPLTGDPGDGQQQAIWAMHQIPADNVPMLLINSDITDDKSTGSHGGILNFSTAEFIDFLPTLRSGDFEVEPWRLIEVEIDGQTIMVGSEVYFGERESTDFSANHIMIGEQEGRTAGSGTLVATGAGTQKGSWFDAATHFMPERPGPQPMTNAAMYMTNLCHNRGRDIPFDMDVVTVDGNTEIHITSMNDSDGIIRADSIKGSPWTIPFPEQSTAIVRLAQRPLMVVKNSAH